MDVRNCRNCGRLFNYLSGPNICPVCKEEADKKFNDVKEYVRNNPMSSISEVAENNDVSAQQIKQWIREERLQFADDSPIGIECERCGAIIKSGKYCDSCKNNMASSLTEAFQRPQRQESQSTQQQSGDRMFFKR